MRGGMVWALGDAADIMPSGASPSLREWTRVEAVLKADGRGLRVEPGGCLAVEGDRRGWRATVAGSPHAFDGWELTGPPGVVVSVAWSRSARRRAPAAAAGRAMP